MTTQTKVTLAGFFLATVWPAIMFWSGVQVGKTRCSQNGQRFDVKTVAGLPVRIDRQTGQAQVIQLELPAAPASAQR